MWYFPRWSLVAALVGALLLGGFALSPYAPHGEIRSATQTDATEEGANKELARYTFWLMVFTGALAVASVVQFRFVIRADRTARLAAEAAKASADMLPAIERAYVRFDAKVSLFAGEGRIRPDVPVQVTFRNYGKTPADCRARYCEFRYWPQEPSPHPKLSEWGGEQPQTVAGGEALTLDTVRLTITDEEYSTALKMRGYMYLVAKVIYFDIFGERHETAICYTWDIGMDRFFEYERPSTDERLNYHT